MAKHEAPAPEPNPVAALLAAHVKSQLASATGVFKIAVHHLWDDRFRVNVHTGADFVSAVVSHSYFVVADAKGNIVSSIPAMGPSV